MQLVQQTLNVCVQMQRKAAAQEKQVEDARERMRRARIEVEEKATQKAFQKETFIKASRAEVKKKKEMKTKKAARLKHALEKAEQEAEARHDMLTPLQRAKMFHLVEHSDHNCPKASVPFINDTTWSPPLG